MKKVWHEVNTHEFYETDADALKVNQEVAENVGCPHCSSYNVKVNKIGEVLLMELNTKCLDCGKDFQVAPFELLLDEEIDEFIAKRHITTTGENHENKT